MIAFEDDLSAGWQGLPAEITQHYVAMRELPDGRVCGVMRLLFHWTLHVGVDLIGYADRYCYQDREVAVAAMLVWDGRGDPMCWHRHLASGRRRDLTTGREWISA
jgi:hypothetical protein